MRRAPIVITATVLGSAGVLLFRPLPVSGLSASGAAASTGVPSSGATAAARGSAGSGSRTGAKDGTWTGAAETVRYGTTRVRVTIAGGRITDVAVVQENQDEQRSVEISESAFPVLREEVLTKQTAAVDAVSGATYTSEQYEASLQSALDAAGFTAADGSTASTDVAGLEGSGH